ncbi:Hypothetical predicted protein [Xyrichtys novacula]|uniref:Uncharacterized protein n=1 Tax=Xyrichtys novacula TaxID=13765 RepID=A0AAV1EMZ9_XYRNO|nr:Hypothetical predicted protein [Xyrichtys novacula]
MVSCDLAVSQGDSIKTVLQDFSESGNQRLTCGCSLHHAPAVLTSFSSFHEFNQTKNRKSTNSAEIFVEAPRCLIFGVKNVKVGHKNIRIHDVSLAKTSFNLTLTFLNWSM